MLTHKKTAAAREAAHGLRLDRVEGVLSLEEARECEVLPGGAELAQPLSA